MPGGYQKQRSNWQDFPVTSTPILAANLNALETAIYDLKHGDLTIQDPAESAFVKAAASQSADLMQWRDVSNNVLASVTKLGVLSVSTSPAASAAGQVHGLKATVGTSSPSNPVSGDYVALYHHIVSSAARTRIWAGNPVAEVASGFDAHAKGLEVNMHNDGTDVTTPAAASNHKLGIDIVNSGTVKSTAALDVDTPNLAAAAWHHGVYIRGATDTGITISNVATGYTAWPSVGISIGLPNAAITGGLAIKQFDNSFSQAIVLQRFTDSSPVGDLIRCVNAANSAIIANIAATGEIRSTIALGTQHMAAATPTGGSSGDIRVGNSKIWVNDAGTWKSVAIA